MLMESVRVFGRIFLLIRCRGVPLTRQLVKKLLHVRIHLVNIEVDAAKTVEDNDIKSRPWMDIRLTSDCFNGYSRGLLQWTISD